MNQSNNTRKVTKSNIVVMIVLLIVVVAVVTLMVTKIYPGSRGSEPLPNGGVSDFTAASVTRSTETTVSPESISDKEYASRLKKYYASKSSITDVKVKSNGKKDSLLKFSVYVKHSDKEDFALYAKVSVDKKTGVASAKTVDDITSGFRLG